MSKIALWKCPDTGIVFEDEIDYTNYRKLVYGSSVGIRPTYSSRRLRDLVETAHRTLWSFSQIEAWLGKNFTTLLKYSSRKSSINVKMDFDLVVMFESVFCKNMRNIYSAPNGKPSNRYSEPGIPTNYPGWSGKITFSYFDPKKLIDPSEPVRTFHRLLIHLGLGSCRQGQNLRFYGVYEFNMWCADWKALTSAEVISKLGSS